MKWFWICVWSLGLGVASALALEDSRPPPGFTAGWGQLSDCVLIPKPANDGDSFHVRYKGQEFIFRLYFVDTPETTEGYPDRVKEQADYFGLTPEEAIKLGEQARAFTAEFLNKPVKIRTKWEDARGNSRLPRYYAFVSVNDHDLAEALVEQGLARVYGMTAKGEERRWKKLESLEAKAKAAKLGGWATKSSERFKTELVPEHPFPNVSARRPSH